MRTLMLVGCVATLAATVAVGAQGAASGMGPKNQMDMTKTYVGCLARNADGHFTLANASAEMKSDKPMAKGKDTMGKDSMGTMSKDAMGKDTMGKDTMGKDSMGKDAMMSLTLGLSSAKVDLSKHVGHQVSVTGSDAQPMGTMAMFTVTSLKMVSSSCAMQ